ncbi:tetratricopeptide repeat protein [Kitasatospora purpeofusca]|uniref:tetratricopeptide repeat protein n=1 Tax=Kitasatospora purpeofusca TaxID=67352 RepID=UPI0037F94A66
MTPPRWPWRGRAGKPSIGERQTGNPPQGIDAEGPSSQVRVSGEGAVGAGRDISHSAVGEGSRVEHTEVSNRVAGGTVHGDLYQAENVTITHHHPVPAPGPVVRPVRVGTVPPLASAFQPRPGLREEIDRARERHATVVLTQVLSGGGGVGKSQLAAAYAWQAHAGGVAVLVWVNAAESAQIVAAYAQAARLVGAPGADGQDAEADAGAFLDWLAVTERSWLVVLDDLTDLEGAQRWWPRPPAGTNIGGRVLATTRRRDALVTGSGRAVVDIGTYTRTEALEYLGERFTAADAPHLLDDRAEDLVEALGRLPLALAHAAAYMINDDVGCGGYLGLFTDRASHLASLLPPGADTDGYGRQVTTSLLLALDAAEHREPVGLAAPAIRLAAHLDPAGHPDTVWATEAVTQYLTAHRTASGASEPVTPEQARAALRLLHHYALLTHTPRDSDRAVRLHALTARAARETLPPADNLATVHAAADALVEAWPEHEHTARDLTAVLRANTDTLADHAGDLLWHPDGHPVLFTTGRSLNSTGLFGAAVTHWQRVAADAERLLGHDHPHTLNARAGLAASYWQAGRTGEAIVIEERVLADRERLLGADHLETVRARANLAVSYWQAVRTGEAIVIEERVLADRERVLGADHPDTLRARANLAASYWQAGRTGEATDLLERVIADREQLFGVDHPDTLSARANLAASYWQARRTGEAIGLLERVIADRERVLGVDHPETLISRANLAASYWQAGRTGEATDLLERVLADRERVLGDDHPDTVAAADHLRHWRMS